MNADTAKEDSRFLAESLLLDDLTCGNDAVVSIIVFIILLFFCDGFPLFYLIMPLAPVSIKYIDKFLLGSHEEFRQSDRADFRKDGIRW